MSSTQQAHGSHGGLGAKRVGYVLRAFFACGFIVLALLLSNARQAMSMTNDGNHGQEKQQPASASQPIRESKAEGGATSRVAQNDPKSPARPAGSGAARVVNHVTVVRDGMHNAFTTMVYWQGAYWIAYRKGTAHSNPEAYIGISTSRDRDQWSEVAHIDLPGDDRDPRFVVMSDDRLALLFPNEPDPLQATEERPLIEQWITFSKDGLKWEKPQRILEPRHHLFRVRQHNGLYYGLDCYREGTARRLEIWTSPDLLDWTRLCQVGADEIGMNESDIIFRPDGEAWIVSRTQGRTRHGHFASASPPYTDWRVQTLGLRMDAPCIFEHEGRIYVAGRSVPKLLGENTWPFGQSLYIWDLKRGVVKPILRIPTAGDSTYPDVIHDPDGRLCMSYYSQHAYCLGVVPPFDAEVAEMPQNARVNDIYFVEMELP